MGVRWDRRECRKSAGREHPARRSREFTPPSAAYPAHRSREISAAARGYPMPAAHPSPPFAGDHTAVHGSPRPAVRGRSRPPPRLTLSRRPAADSSPVDPVHMFRPGVPCFCKQVLLHLFQSKNYADKMEMTFTL